MLWCWTSNIFQNTPHRHHHHFGTYELRHCHNMHVSMHEQEGSYLIHTFSNFALRMITIYIPCPPCRACCFARSVFFTPSSFVFSAFRDHMLFVTGLCEYNTLLISDMEDWSMNSHMLLLLLLLLLSLTRPLCVLAGEAPEFPGELAACELPLAVAGDCMSVCLSRQLTFRGLRRRITVKQW